MTAVRSSSYSRTFLLAALLALLAGMLPMHAYAAQGPAPGPVFVTSVTGDSDTITIKAASGLLAVDDINMSCANLTLPASVCPSTAKLAWSRPPSATKLPNEVVGDWTDTQIVLRNTAYFPGALLKALSLRVSNNNGNGNGQTVTTVYTLPEPLLLAPRIDAFAHTATANQYTISGATFGRLTSLVETLDDGTTRAVQKPGTAQPNTVPGVTMAPGSWGENLITVTDTGLAAHKLVKITFYYLNSAGTATKVIDATPNLYFVGTLTSASSSSAGQVQMTGTGLQAVTKLVFTMTDNSQVTVNVPENTGSFNSLSVTSSALAGKTIKTIVATIADNVQTMTLANQSVRVKDVAPFVTITSPFSGQIVNPAGANATFSLGGGAAAGTTCQIDINAAKACTSPFNMGVLTSGSHKLTVIVTGLDGQTGTSSVTFNVAAPPTVSITSGPANGDTTGPDVSFGFSSTNAYTTSCQLDSTTYSNCTSPRALTTSVGNHTFMVIVTDLYGNSVTATRTFTVVAAPTLSQLSGTPASPTTATSATFTWTEGGGAAVASCTIDGAASPCTSPVSFIDLTAGDHTFVVKLTNASGTATRSATWHIAATPTVDFTAGPAENASTGDGTAITWAASAAATSATCQLDAAAAAPCAVSGTRNFTGLADGPHAFTVTVKTDENITASATRNFKVVNAPTVVFTTRPANSTSTTATAAWSTTGQVDTTTCKLDSDAAASCASPLSMSGLSVGDHTLTVKVSNSLNAAVASDTVTWAVRPAVCEAPAVLDVASPALNTISLACYGLSNLDQVTLTTGGGSFTYYNPAGPNANLNAADLVITWTDGKITITDAALSGATISDVTSRLLSGDPSVEVHNLNVNAVSPPIIKVTAPASGAQVAAPGLMGIFTLTGGPASTVTCKVDAAVAAACVSPVDLSALAPGSHTLTVAASGKGGVADPASVTFTVVAAPALAITSPTAGQTVSEGSTLPLAFTNSGGAATATCQIDTSAAFACASGDQLTVAGAGSHSLTVTLSGVGGTAQSSVAFTIAAAPVLTLTSPTDGQSVIDGSQIQVAFTNTGGAATATCQIDSDAAFACASGDQLTASGIGSHTLTVTLTGAGGVDAKSVSYSVAASSPNIKFSIADNARFASAAGLSLGWTNTGSAIASMTCYVYEDQYTNYDYKSFPCASPIDLSSLGEGQPYIYFQVVGADGSTSYPSVSFNIGAEAMVSIDRPNVTAAQDGTVTVPFTATDSTSTTCSLHNADYSVYVYKSSCASPVVFTGLSGGTYSIDVQVSNNTSYNSDTVSVTIQTAPVVKITAPTEGASVAANGASFTYTLDKAVDAVGCQLDGAAVACGTVSQTSFTGSLGSLSAGAHSLTITATNSIGTTTKTVNFSSAVRPTITFTSGPADGAEVRDNGALYGLSIVGAPSGTCRLDNLAAQTCSTQFMANTGGYNLVGAGTHTVTVSASNAAGFTSVARTFTIPAVPLLTSNAATGPGFGQFERYDYSGSGAGYPIGYHNFTLRGVLDEAADGSMVVYGSFSDYVQTSSSVVNRAQGAVIMKVKADLTLDTSFGTNGLIRMTTSTTYQFPELIDVDGQFIYVVSYGADSSHQRVITRYDKLTGVQDTAFGSVTVSLPTTGAATIHVLRNIESDGAGGLVVTGSAFDTASNYNDWSGLVIHVKADGTQDMAFGNAGAQIMRPATVNGCSGSATYQRYDIMDDQVLPSGKIVVSGTVEGAYLCAASGRQVLYSLNADGSIDASFATAGYTTLGYGAGRAADGYNLRMDLSADGTKLTVVGGGLSSTTFARYTITGLPDNTFNPSAGFPNQHAKSILEYPIGFAASTVTRTASGGYLLGGTGNYSWSALQNKNAMVKTDADGNIDTAFGANGILTVGADLPRSTYAGGAPSAPYGTYMGGVYLDSAGRALLLGHQVSGGTSNASDGRQALIRRFTATGAEG